MFDTNVVELGTSYSAECVDEGFPDQTISDNIVTCTHCKSFDVNDYCVCLKSVIIAVLIRRDSEFVRYDTVMCLQNFLFYSGIIYADLVNGALYTERCGTDQQYVTEESHA
jgi:hypothetical protein